MAFATGTNAHWRDNKKLSECMLNMLKNENMCDVTFHVGGEKKPIKAHKLILSSRSHVFNTMFEGSLPKTEVIPIPNVDESTFSEFLRYMYSDEVPSISHDNVNGMFYLSDEYRMPRIKKECKKFLRMKASTNDAAKSLQIAYEYSLENLLNKSLSFIEENTSQCLSSSYALDLSIECLELILKSEYLSCSENDLFSFFLRWTKNQCTIKKVEPNGANLRTMAGNVLFLVRFPLLNLGENRQFILEGLLTSDELCHLQSGIQDGSSPFSNKERHNVGSSNDITVLCYQYQLSTPQMSNKVEALQFETNKDIWLKGVVIGSIIPVNQILNQQLTLDLSSSLIINFQVLSACYKELYSCEKMIFATQVPTTPFWFLKPVRLSKFTKYTITMEGLQLNSVHFLKCVNPVSVDNVTVTFEKSSLCTRKTNETQGPFAGLIFSI